MNPNLWWFAVPVALVVAAKAHAEFRNWLDPEYGPDLPEGWDAEINRVFFWWSVKGINTAEFVTSEVVVSGWAWTRKSAVEKVAQWIDEARSMPEEWMPQVQS